ncbi:MAG: hypothetical protein JO270_18320 [Acidobacteriaceae bacterium]|nr:hypothetical protein [Acidobacteriaceae bacterium]
MQLLEMDKQDEKRPEFRFASKKKYEAALAKLLRDDLGDSPEYESLMEEYLLFCDTELNG